MKGSYILIVELRNDSIISIGKEGEECFNKGYYIYVGSALNGLNQRIQRHLRKQKKIHWHIDYLLKYAVVIDVFYKESKVRDECNIAKKLDGQLFSIPSFGCSDCRCKSHLFYGSFEEVMSAVEKLQMNSYHFDANY
jgi:Uri superfamily endonuclease